MNRREFTAGGVVGAAVLAATATARASSGNVDNSLRVLAEANKAIRDANSVSAAFSSWFLTARNLIPFTHVTALAARSDGDNDSRPGTVRRIFSTVPQAYPVGGWKRLSGSDWAQAVLVHHEPLVASGANALEHYFEDYALLRSLGTETLVNIPVVLCNRAVGAFAFMCRKQLPTDFVTDAMILLASVATPLFVVSRDLQAG